MASRTYAIGVPVIEREEGVIAVRQRRRQPSRRGVACSAGCRPSRRHVIWIRGPGKVRLMAAIASRWRPGKDIVNVAEIAGYCRVGSGQREGRVVVIEGCSGPVCSGVARIAGGGEARSHMTWIRGPGKVSLMAAVASRWQSGVVVIHVAGSASDCEMRPGQRESRRRMVEG